MEFTLTPQTSAEIERRLRPFLARKIHGKPIAEWLMRPQRALTKDDFLPPDIRLTLAATLEDVLATTGGPEGLKLLEALDGIIHGGGSPALVVHGLPTATDIAPIMREAFRQKMFANPLHSHREQLELKDEVDAYKRSGFTPDGTTYFHTDDADVGMLFGVQGGANPRHTEVMTISECVEQVVALMKGDWPDISAHYVTEMLARPIWPVEVTPALCSPLKKAAGDESRAMDATRLQMAQALGLARTGVDGKVYAPIIYANPNFHLHEEGSQPYKILSAPFAQLLARLNHDHTQVSSQDDWMLAALVEVMTEVFKNAPHARKGPVIKEGDLMVFNNRVLLHSGGGPEHLELPKHLREDSSRQPRIINTLDVHTNPSPYPVQPGDRVTKPIRVGIVDQRAVTIDPTSFH